MNAYKVWVKGRKSETQRVEFAAYKINALLTIANAYGLKTIQCDGLLVKRDISRAGRKLLVGAA
jgi:hypothetical protein